MAPKYHSSSTHPPSYAIPLALLLQQVPCLLLKTINLIHSQKMSTQHTKSWHSFILKATQWSLPFPSTIRDFRKTHALPRDSTSTIKPSSKRRSNLRLASQSWRTNGLRLFLWVIYLIRHSQKIPRWSIEGNFGNSSVQQGDVIFFILFFVFR